MVAETAFQRVSWMLFDTVHVLPLAGQTVNFFQKANRGLGETNMDIAGCLPAGVSFEIERLELSALSRGAKKTLLTSFPFASYRLYVANKIYGEWPLAEAMRRHRETTQIHSDDDAIVYRERFTYYGISLSNHLLLDSMMHFYVSISLGSMERGTELGRKILLRAILDGTKIRPVQ